MTTPEWKPKNWVIVCPGCSDNNSLRITHIETTSYRPEAMESPSRKDRGTFATTQEGSKPVEKSWLVECSTCNYVSNSYPTVKEIVGYTP
jgi:DNA-directed RNA polymerase subunit M/transcription elongation factor TFIIS